MRVSTEAIGNRQVVVDIQVEDERLEKAVDQAYRRIVPRLNVPGFRKGKAPRALVERMIGREALLEDAIEHLVPVIYREAVEAEGIKPAAQPKLEVVSATPLQVKATVPLEPHVELGDYKATRLTLESAEVTAEEVDQMVERLREAHAEWVPIERAVQFGDRVGIDVQATVGERSLLDSKDAEFVVDPEGAEPAPGFSEQLVGMEPEQERAFMLKLPEDMKDKELAGQEAAFTVKLHWVKERQLPELDDGFASTVGAFENVEQVRKAISDDLKARKEQASQRKLEEAAIEAVVSSSTVEMPPQVVEHEAEHLRDQLASSLDRQGISIEQYIRFAKKNEAEFRAELLDQAEKTVKQSAVLKAIASAEGVDVSDAEVDEEIRRIAQDSPDSRRLAQNAMARPDTRERVRSVLRERKAVRRLLDIATEASPESPMPQETHGETHEQPV